MANRRQAWQMGQAAEGKKASTAMRGSHIALLCLFYYTTNTAQALSFLPVPDSRTPASLSEESISVCFGNQRASTIPQTCLATIVPSQSSGKVYAMFAATRT
jgi:hypothetical protein